MLKCLSVLASALLLTGCAGISEVPPTIATVDQGKEWRMTYVEPSDFKADGSMRSISEYNFHKESAPCSVLEEYRAPAVYKEQYFVRQTLSQHPVLFICRNTTGIPTKNKFRLYLVGTEAECNSRWWQMGLSNQPFFQKMNEVCRQPHSTYLEVKLATGKADLVKYLR